MRRPKSTSHIFRRSTAEPGGRAARACTPFPPNIKPTFESMQAWAEPFQQFVESINSAFLHEPHEPHLWICAAALFQTTNKDEIAKQLGSDPNAAPFTKALRQAERFLVVRNRAVDLHDRIWCI